MAIMLTTDILEEQSASDAKSTQPEMRCRFTSLDGRSHFQFLNEALQCTREADRPPKRLLKMNLFKNEFNQTFQAIT